MSAEADTVAGASEEASRQICNLLSHDDVNKLNHLQQLILGRLQDSNAVLSHFNEYSEESFIAVSSDFSKNTRLLKSMKTDLDYIFQKLRSMKTQISGHHRHVFNDISSSAGRDEKFNLDEA